jgi:two-component system sensor histidine kinase TctE
LRNLRKRENPDVQRSLFGEILDWMLAPLLFVWPISIAFTHYFANSVASFPYDQSLREHVAAISRQISFVDGRAQLALPGLAQSFLRSDEIDNVYFHLLGRRQLIAATRNCRPAEARISEPGARRGPFPR